MTGRRPPGAGGAGPVSDYCHISRITGHPANIRDDPGDLSELVASIKAHGILQPLVVRPHPQRHGWLVVLGGHRRLAAARLAGLEEVPVVVREAAGPAKDIEIMLVENCQRRDLGPIEKAEAMGALRDRGYSNLAIAKATGLADATICTYLALLDLDASSQEKIRNRELAVSVAVEAVRKTRARQRQRAGQKNRSAGMRLSWAPDHFTERHPLARQANELCDAREHNMRRRIGKVACGQCWETVIRADERTAMAALAGANGTPPAPQPVRGPPE